MSLEGREIKLVIVEGPFVGFEDEPPREDVQWLCGIRRKHGRLHVALWPTDGKVWNKRANALLGVSGVWEVHCGKAKDVLPWLQQKEPEAHIKVIARIPEYFNRD